MGWPLNVIKLLMSSGDLIVLCLLMYSACACKHGLEALLSIAKQNIMRTAESEARCWVVIKAGKLGCRRKRPGAPKAAAEAQRAVSSMASARTEIAAGTIIFMGGLQLHEQNDKHCHSCGGHAQTSAGMKVLLCRPAVCWHPPLVILSQGMLAFLSERTFFCKLHLAPLWKQIRLHGDLLAAGACWSPPPSKDTSASAVQPVV